MQKYTFWKKESFAGFEVLKTVVMESSIFWNITPCSPLKVNRKLGGTCRLHLQGRKTSQARNQREAGSKQSNQLAEISDYTGN
jgi:hypothetical protein